ncbi:MAG TPA: SDR family NAD(P)-dependent oxidoreductase [Cyclobacteriaceae bacterium]|nr:SDR family NAD(P)-dependent oxidoreductase [Cyclobacteriaceae bacterium]HMV10627.1 SDR family NAD(P)-dependent oxidoreductase [Cyclobacteriaceae bacterium]HMV91021.1 SDR family NAD(P)-dependent oxidoreductase [Cyclobacteriaceae bacterium]HMX02614.1 SDR family NAD(P)-dependent oxidoreductase [Cyclobacteriaceae bacterium]HMX50887.1 SDR family NAD(P)-dependent oxidoreductase [Cyclobacteriaceae bacterium]
MRKLIVVTGATKGIGRAIAERFAQEDFDVVICARKSDELEKLKADFGAKYPSSKVYVQAADMADRKQIDTFVNFIRQIGRPVDVLVNNAGYFVPGSIATEKEGVLEDMMNANLFSAYHMSRGLVDQMIARKSGHIFNMCSIASIKAYANGGSYAITKFALLGLSKCLREELKSSGIRVTAILPGATRTASWDGVDLPEERFMSVEDVAETVYAAYSLSKRTVVEEILIRPQLGDI